MKKLLIVSVLCLFVVISCSLKNKQAVVKGKITLANQAKVDSFYVGLYRLGSRELLGKPIYYSVSSEPSFSFDVVKEYAESIPL